MKQDDADLLWLLDYLDGRLSEDQRIAFELRLAEEPDLAAERDALERMDHLQRMAVAAGRIARRERLQRRWPGRALLALAAAASALLGARWLLAPGEAEPEVAILASAPTLPEHNVLLGLGDADLRKVPPGFGLRGAGGELETIPVDEYLALTSDAQEQRIGRALDQAAATATAVSFVVLVRAPCETSALVVLVGPDGATLAYPEESPWTAASGRLSGSDCHVLPGPVVQRRSEPAGPRIAYEPGFFVPRGAGGTSVLVGLREAPLDAGLRAALERVAGASPSVDGLASWLLERGFEVRRLTVGGE